MKKNILFIFSLFIAVFIFISVKYSNNDQNQSSSNEVYKTFVKKSNKAITSYQTTKDEFKKAAISNKNQDRSPADEDSKPMPFQDLPQRENRIIIGENAEKYKDSSSNLTMLNKPNKNWKELLGADLLRFQAEDTKVIIKEELSLIKVQEEKGLYAEQVIITYLLKNGDRTSYRALVDAESGLVLETWDKTIHERMRKRRADLAPLPLKLND